MCCIFCDVGWKYKTICSKCIQDDDKVSLFHLTTVISFLHNISLDEKQINKLMDKYEELIKEKKTQKEIYKILLAKYKKGEK